MNSPDDLETCRGLLHKAGMALAETAKERDEALAKLAALEPEVSRLLDSLERAHRCQPKGGTDE